jgi:hypothetical protein
VHASINGSTGNRVAFPGIFPRKGLKARARARARMLLAPSLFLLSCAWLVAPAAAHAEPLSPESPLYNPSAPIVDENPNVSAEYSGTITQEYSYSRGEETDKRKATLHWKTSVSGPVDQIEYTAIYNEHTTPPAVRWSLDELSGEVTDSGVRSGHQSFSCSNTFTPQSKDGGEGGVDVPLDEPGFPASGGNPATNPDYEVIPPNGLPSSLISGDEHATGNDFACATSEWQSNGTWLYFAESQAGATEATGPQVYFPPSGSHTQEIDFSSPCPSNCGTGVTFNVEITSSLTFSAPGLPPATSTSVPIAGSPASPAPPPPPTPDTDPRKHNAATDLGEAFEKAKVPCGAAALGSVAAASKGGALTTLVGDSSASGQVGDAGRAVLSGWGPLCDAAIIRLEQDLRTAADPPAPDWHALAQPAKARRKKPAAGSPACKGGKLTCELSPVQGGVVVAARRVASVDEAIETTISRETAALDAYDPATALLQSAHAAVLESEFRSALSGETAAESKLVGDLHRIGLRIDLSAKQTAKGARLILARLAAKGISEAQLKAYTSAVL